MGRCLSVIAALLVLSPLMAHAQEAGIGAWTHTAHADVRLIAAQSAVSPDQTRLALGLEFALQPEWKIYWRSPGDAGLPPVVRWEALPAGTTVTMAWPAPRRHSEDGLETIGYQDRVVFPLTVERTAQAEAVTLSGQVNFLICANICVPAQADVGLGVPLGQGGAPPATSQARLLSQFTAQVPGPHSGLSLLRASLGDDHQLTVVVRAEHPFDHAPDALVEGASNGVTGFKVGGLEVGGLLSGPPLGATLRDGGREAEITVALTTPIPPGTPLTLTVIDAGRGLETVIRPLAGNPSSLMAIIGLALLGGFILNFMPCVLPVLSLKLFGLVNEPNHRRPVAVATAAGMVATFLALAGVLVGLKAAGVAVGWGIQFQQPVFLAVMITLLGLFTANLWGLFEFRLPGFIGDVASQQPTKPTSLWGHAASGVLVTLLATPCSAPFLGTAVGFALARGPGEILLVFACLGLGMAAPYGLLAVSPGLIGWLPRPGRWMLTFKKVMAVSMAATALWLGWILATQLGVFSWIAPEEDRIGWQRFDPILLEKAHTQVIFVDVTADWCLTCKVNKAAVLHNPSLIAVLSAPAVLALKADWTSPDAGIAAYLASFGRYGIPFNVIYGPRAPQGIVLPEILTEASVTAALKAARSEATSSP